jgi:hypothetical protein
LVSITVIWTAVRLDSPCIEEEESWLAPDECGSLRLLHADMGIGSNLIRMLLDLTLIASLKAVGVSAVGVVLVSGDIGVLVALLSIHVCLYRDFSSRLLLPAEESHLAARDE